MLNRLFHIAFLLAISGFGKTLAQTDFSEGTLIYRIDTLRRLETHPSNYRATQFKLYKKGDLIRVETLSINKFDSTDRQRTIEIRNTKGIYTIIEQKPAFSIDSLVTKLAISKDSLLKVFPMFNEFALFSTYEEEKISRATAALQGRLKPYTVKKIGQKATLLTMPIEKIMITSSDQSDPVAVQVTQSLHAPVGLFFESLRKIEGTPLEFTEPRFGWLYRYTIESINTQPVPNELFQIDPNRRVLTDDQLLQEAKDLIK